MSLDIPLEAKEAFYEQLDALDASLEDEDFDEDFDDAARRQSRAFFDQATTGKRLSKSAEARATNTIAAGQNSTPATKQPRGASTTLTPAVIEATPLVPNNNDQASRRRVPISASFVQDTPIQEPRASTLPSLHRSLTVTPSVDSLVKQTPTSSTSSMAGTSGRKRPAKGKGKNEIPEENQVLKSLRLFYIPAARISLRKHRIEHAERHGATVTDQLAEATHIVVDQHLKYDNIKDSISPILGNDSVTLVSDQWPLDCIQQGRVLPCYLKYRVRDTPSGESVFSTKSLEQPATQVSDQSLELKEPHNNPRRWDYVPPMTPSHSTASPLQFLDQRRGSETLEATRPSPQEAAEGTTVVPSSSGAHDEAVDTREKPIDSAKLRRGSSGFGDELSEVITEAREQFKNLPRIGDEDATLNRGEGGDIDESDSEGNRGTKKRKKGTDRTAPKEKRLKEFFACSRGGTKDQAADSDNPNALTISVFQKMLDYYTRTNDHWRTRAYRNIITTLSTVTDRRITTAEEALELPFFGQRLADKLEEINRTHTLQRLQYALGDPTSQVKALFLGIYGVGPSTAEKWIAQGFRTFDDLLEKAQLSESQRIGIEHYEDINSRIPRAEVTKIAEYVKAEAAKTDSAVELVVGGSYRRGAYSSGDVDFIITKKGTTSSKDLIGFLDKFVASLTRQGFLTAALAAHSSNKDGSKWHGCCALPWIPGFNDDENYRPVWRRIDLLLVPETEYGAALIYFTGNDIFNRSIRLLASRKQMRLNQRGLYKDVLRGWDRQNISEGELVEGRDEKRIFKILGVKWREPHDRWC